jgi:TPR repeat protein
MKVITRSSPRIVAFCLALGMGTASARLLMPHEVGTTGASKEATEALRKLKDMKEAPTHFKVIKAAADEGDASALTALGFLYQMGVGTERSIEAAGASYKRAIAKGSMAAKNNLGLMQLAGGSESKASIEMVEQAASSGFDHAQVSMGQIFLEGLPTANIAKDLDQARVWFERASASGSAEAFYALGIIYEKGVGVTANQETSVAMFEKAVAGGLGTAMVHLGGRYITGNGVKADPGKGRELLTQAIAKEESGARTALATVYEVGAGGEKDLKKAFDLYTESYAAGEYQTANKLGYFYENGLGVTKDDAKAAEWYRKGADQGVGVCMHNLAIFCEDGKGGLAKSAEEAFNWFYKAAMTAFVPSQRALAQRYQEGRGVMQDPQAALSWFERAMQNGDVDAKVSYAAILEAGIAGFVNAETAQKLYNEAVGQNHVGAMLGLGGMLETGKAGVLDLPKAYALYVTAGKAGLKVAAERADRVKSRLTPEQLKQADALLAANSGGASPPAAPEGSGKPAPKPVAKPAAKAPPAKAKSS